jgi:MFS family permease
MSINPASFVFIVCLAEILSMSGTMFFPALLTGFQAEWGITNTEAGWINGVFFGGYALASPILVSLTDRVDPRRIYLPSAFLGMVSLILFGWLADGTAVAAMLRLLAGIGLAGTYMPGLKALSDQITGPNQSRSVVFYTSSFGIGTALSVFFSGLTASWIGWRTGAILLALGPLASAFLFAAAVRPDHLPYRARRDTLRPERNIRQIFNNRSVLGYILCYAVHCWELFGFRSWLVAFLVYSLHVHPGVKSPLSPQDITMLILLVGVGSTIMGNEGALRWGRRRAVSLFMIASGVLGGLIGFGVHLPFPLVVTLSFCYGITIMLDSGSLTAGVVAGSDEGQTGMTLAVHSFVGFGMAFLSPLAFGAILDLTGHTGLGWGLAFASLGLVNATGPLWLRLFRSRK